MCDIEPVELNTLKNSAPLSSCQNSLKNSIGKNRGVFVPVIAIDNSDFDDDDDIWFSFSFILKI